MQTSKEAAAVFQMALSMALQAALTPRAITTITTASGSPSSGDLWTIFGDQWGALDRRPIRTIPLQKTGFGGGIYRYNIREANITQMEVQQHTWQRHDIDNTFT